ncbi:FUSC family protein [Streptomyces sp. NPDC058326]|uniref:FUSC family protein n=1 Tax=Streptomyces sp. NPDC058326 TaxID=3346447 RepID=UPI0036ECF436
MAPDPGLVRLRISLRAVLGIALAVAVAELLGLSLVASITAGLAALLALFTVGDPTVRRQAVTTALLPTVGFPVLALATLLHDAPLLRDATWLLIAFAGVYARRWGPRGHALGIFAFMQFFVTQFLHALPAQLPELYAATGIALAAAAAVRFVLWPIERRVPPPAVPAALPGTGFARATTRQAVQVAVASGVALVVGQLLSGERWYWAVGTVWWIFVNTASRGETLVRGFRRVLGTATGIAAGFLVAIPLGGAPVLTALLVAVCVFGIFYTAAVSYSWMILAVTVMASLLYGLLGVLDGALLLLRVAETGVGAVCAVLAVTLVLPVRTHTTNDAWIQRALLCVRSATSAAVRRLAGEEADPAPHAAELEALLGRVRLSLAPLVHPLNPLRARKERARRVLVLLDQAAGEVRGLVAVAADADASHDARLAAACWRVEAAVEALTSREGPAAADLDAHLSPEGDAHPGTPAHLRPEGDAHPGTPAPLKSEGDAHPGTPAPLKSEGDAHPGTPALLKPEGDAHVGAPALIHARGLARVLTELDAPLRTPPGAWVVRS